MILGRKNKCHFFIKDEKWIQFLKLVFKKRSPRFVNHFAPNFLSIETIRPLKKKILAFELTLIFNHDFLLHNLIRSVHKERKSVLGDAYDNFPIKIRSLQFFWMPFFKVCWFWWVLGLIKFQNISVIYL